MKAAGAGQDLVFLVNLRSPKTEVLDRPRILLPVDCNNLRATGRHHLREGILSHHFQGLSAAHFVIE